MSGKSTFDTQELFLLNSYRALSHLLSSDKIDFKETLRQLQYEKRMQLLQARFIEIQNRVVQNNERVLIIFEGREFAGKAGAIQVMTEHLNPRSIRKVALQKPSAVEASQWYFKRYVSRIPESGEMVFFDRSWYNRAVVEPVNDFCTNNEYDRFMKEVNHFERMLSEDGILLIKLYYRISKKEQKKRIDFVQNNRLRRWELTPVDLKAIELWDDYSKFEKVMFKKTSTKANPWYRFNSNDKRTAQLNSFEKVLEILETNME